MSGDSQTPMAVVRSFMSLMEVMNYDAAVTHLADDCRYINPPPIGEVAGPAGVRAVLEPFFAPFKTNEFRILREASNGGIVVLERLDRHLLGDRWVELPVTGVFEVTNGKITYWRDYFDYPTIASQLG